MNSTTTTTYAKPYRTAWPEWTMTACRNCDAVIVYDDLSWYHQETGLEPCHVTSASPPVDVDVQSGRS